MSSMFAKVLRVSHERADRDQHTQMPARVVRYFPETCEVELQPCVEDARVTLEGDYEHDAFPMLVGVPVIWPGGGDYRITFPLVPGDTGLVEFMEVSTDKWLFTDGTRVVDPQDPRRKHLSDAVFIPGLRTFQRAWQGARQDAITLGKDGGLQVHISETEVRLGGDAATQAVLNGNTYRQAEDAMLNALSTLTNTMAALVTAVIAIPTISGPLSAAGPAVVAAVGALPTAMTAWTNAKAAFDAAAGSYLSQTVKVAP